MSDAKYLESGFREMVKSDLQGGTVSLNHVAYDCTVGAFTRQDVLVPGGISPKMAGDVQVLLTDLPADLDLKLGLKLTVVPNVGKVRECQLSITQNSGNYINLLVWDVNQSA